MTAAEEARELIVFCDGIEDAGHPELARRSRALARDYLRLAEMFDAERSARQRIQADRDRAIGILAEHAGQAAVDDGR